jgi:transitional endoplasmic reticulum ATPase
VDIHLSKREKIRQLGGSPIRGVLFSGPPGTGKTFLAKIIAGQVGATLYVVSASQLGGHLVGESEGRLDALYAHAGKQDGVSLIFFDELDSITRARGSENGSHASRMVNTFLSNLDGFLNKDDVVTIGTTNRYSDMDSALTRHGRFGFHIMFRHPAADDREQILRAQQNDGKLVRGVLPLRAVAEKTANWTGADLHAVWTYAAGLAAEAGRDAIAEDHFWIAVEMVESDRAQRESLLGNGG